MDTFAAKHRLGLEQSDRSLAAAFEVGCFHFVIDHYSRLGFETQVYNLHHGTFRYLTSPNGNPNNFSFVRLVRGDSICVVRQQVRIRSLVDDAIAFTPDLVVLHDDHEITGSRDSDYAHGRRSFYFARADTVIAAHECKSLVPFPELIVGFLGIVALAHSWYVPQEPKWCVHYAGEHLAPTLFVGGAASPWHRKMVNAVQDKYPVNIMIGLHRTMLGRRLEAQSISLDPDTLTRDEPE